MANLISGLYSTDFYKLLEPGLLARGYANLEDWLKEQPNYWFDEAEWKSIYTLAPFENPARTFDQKIGDRSVPIMATYLSDEAEGPLLPTPGFEKQTGEIPRMGRGLTFDIDAYEKMQMLARQGVNVTDQFYNQFMKDTMNLVQSIHSQRTFTGFQVESKGSYVTTKATSNGGIVGFEINLNPVAENRKKCGGFWLGGYQHGTKNAWSSPSAKPLGDLEDMFNYGWRMRIIPRDPKASVFRMSASGWETLKAHADTKTRVAFWKYGPTSGSLDAYVVTDTDLKNYISDSGLPAIEVVSYFGFGTLINPKTKKFETVETEAFDANTVVLRPAGKVGEIQWKRASNMLATADSPIMYTDGGSMAICEDRGKKGLTFQIESICLPVPKAIQTILYLSTNEAAS
ncbi:MAG: hypothetical protein IJP77_06150 [Bacteroidales bacterium]|nr:hypothetical protein [Bacteroidales bacterium]